MVSFKLCKDDYQTMFVPSKFKSPGFDRQGKTVRKCGNKNSLNNCFVIILVGFIQTLQRWLSDYVCT